jgi:hypothetical protein
VGDPILKSISNADSMEFPYPSNLKGVIYNSLGGFTG